MIIMGPVSGYQHAFKWVWEKWIGIIIHPVKETKFIETSLCPQIKPKKKTEKKPSLPYQ